MCWFLATWHLLMYCACHTVLTCCLSMTESPRTLTHLCRLRIRRCFTSRQLVTDDAILSLSLPKHIQQYLLYDGLNESCHCLCQYRFNSTCSTLQWVKRLLGMWSFSTAGTDAWTFNCSTCCSGSFCRAFCSLAVLWTSRMPKGWYEWMIRQGRF